MSTNIRVGGTYRDATGFHIKVGGTWRRVLEGHIKVGGVWEQFHFGEQPFMDVPRTVSSTGVIVKGSGSASCTFQLDNDGTIDASGTGVFSVLPAISDANEWGPSPIVPADWEVFATLTSGTTPTTNAGLSTWLSLGTDRTWGNAVSGGGAATVTSTLTFTFRKISSPTPTYAFAGTTIVASIS